MRQPSRTTVVPQHTDEDVPLRDPTDAAGGDGRIRCPLCGWSPRAEDRWRCDCKFEWNTFDTGGVCPGCMKQWTMTACLSCHQWSPHSDWYPKH